MRKLILCVLMLLSLSMVFGFEMRRSNIIGQDLGIVDSQSEYYLTTSGKTTQLYGPEGLVWTEEHFIDDDQLLVVRSYHLKEQKTSTVFVNGFPLQQMKGEETLYYKYGDDMSLEQVTCYRDGEFIYTKLYIYDETTFRLLSVITLGNEQNSIRYFSRYQDRSYLTALSNDGGQSFIQLGSNTVIESSFPVDGLVAPVSVYRVPGGGFIVYFEDRVETYDSDGMLVEQKTPSSVAKYLYNEKRKLIEERIVFSDTRERISTYEEGALRMVEERKGTLTTSLVTYLDTGGMIKTLFSGGEAYSDITYGQDGMRVLSISYY